MEAKQDRKGVRASVSEAASLAHSMCQLVGLLYVSTRWPTPCVNSRNLFVCCINPRPCFVFAPILPHYLLRRASPLNDFS
eukprot:2856228-Pleurochrysis_carterae.AAC.1